MRETFKDKVPGEFLSVRDTNAWNKVCRQFAGLGPGSHLSGFNGQIAADAPFTQRILIITSIDRYEDEGLYEARPRYWDVDEEAWTPDEDEGPYDLDASEFGDGLQVDDVVVAFWDPIREAFVGGQAESRVAINGRATATYTVTTDAPAVPGSGELGYATFSRLSPDGEIFYGYFLNGMIVEDNNYLLIPFGDKYYVANPTVTAVGKVETSDIPQSTTGTIRLYSTRTGVQLDGPVLMSVYNRLNPTITVDSWVMAQWVDGPAQDTGSDGTTNNNGRWEAIGPISGSEETPTTGQLAQATAFAQTGSVATLTILVPGTVKGTETATGASITAYVRHGLVRSGKQYELFSICPGSDTDYELSNPELTVTGTANADYDVGDAGYFAVDGNNVQATVIVAGVATGTSCELMWSVDHWVAIGNPEDSIDPPNAITGTCITSRNFSFGSSTFTTAAGTKTATISRGFVIAGKEYGLIWADGNHYAVVDPEMTITGNADASIEVADVSGNFTSNGVTVVGYLTRGLCINANDYGLIWADDHWAVSDPEMTIIGKPNGLTLHGSDAVVVPWFGTKGSETASSLSIDARVRKGLVFAAQWVTCQYFDDSGKWEVIDPALSVIGKADADYDAISTVATVSIWTGTRGAETDSTINLTGVCLRFGDVSQDDFVRCSWQDSGTDPGWEVTNVVCG